MFKGCSMVRLGDYISTQSGGTPNTKKSKYYDGGTIPWLSSGEINQGYISSTEKYITEDGLANSAAKWVPQNSVVIAMYGATAGKVGFITIPLTTNQAVCALLPNNAFDPLYLYYAVSSKKDWMISQCRGAAQPNISQGIIRSMEILMPNYDEQMRFAEIIQQADKSKFMRSKSQFIEMFEGNKYPRLSLDEISKEWSKGQGFKKDDICEDGETQCIHYGELFTKYGPVINEVVSRTSVEKKKTSKKGDILFPASDVTPNGLARCSMLPFDNVILGGDIIILRPKDNYNAAYLSYAINQQTSQLLTRVNGGVVKHMSAKGLKTVEVPIPPIDKQEEYIQIAEQADKSKYVVSRNILLSTVLRLC